MKKLSFLLITLFLFIHQLDAQRYKMISYQCTGLECLNHYNVGKKESFYTYDSTARKMNIASESTVQFDLKKGKQILKRYTIKSFDTLGRTSNYKSSNKNGNYGYNCLYDQQSIKIIWDRMVRFTKYNSNNDLISQNVEIKNKKGEIVYQALTKYTYSPNGKVTSIYQQSKKDTSDMIPNRKYYYQNDTGQTEKIEYFKKGKLVHTRIYDCSLVSNKKATSKDSTRVCNSIATDDLGYTFKTYLTKGIVHDIKEVYVYDAQDKLVEINKSYTKDAIDKVFYSKKMFGDSVVTVGSTYNKKLSKVKTAYKQVSFYNKNNQMLRGNRKEWKKNPSKIYTSERFYSYGKNGLMIQSMGEERNHKNKVKVRKKSVFYYTFR